MIAPVDDLAPAVRRSRNRPGPPRSPAARCRYSIGHRDRGQHVVHVMYAVEGRGDLRAAIRHRRSPVVSRYESGRISAPSSSPKVFTTQARSSAPCRFTMSKQSVSRLTKTSRPGLHAVHDLRLRPGHVLHASQELQVPLAHVGDQRDVGPRDAGEAVQLARSGSCPSR